MPSPTVDANYRFIAAYQEVNTRIAQRQQALALYVTLIVSLLAAMVALSTSARAASAPVEWLVLGFPVASLMLALLNYTSERAISNLRTFLSSLERLGDMHDALPSYNTDLRWATSANQARRFRDLATLLLATAGNVMGLGAAWRIYPQRLAEYSGFFVAALILAGLSLICLVLVPQWSYAPDTTAGRA